MSSPSDPLFGIHARALGVWQRRAEAIADNLANADTPDYKARDVDFRKVLAEAGGNDANLQLAAPSSGQASSNGSTPTGNIPLEWRVPLQPSMDGNTVDTQVEQAAYAANSVHYQASLTFITAQIRMLRTAITGGGG
ncbi:MAG TPA: flagellar basal body rod protein FlgB [Rhodanobacteraceae bacterium]|nr:flagellar basal body rod protein FlgB [Oleiagrimonas sp.]HET9819549.1 flagellar basal body rod protein FlgB [Rhodanobacteraceae bacterium]